MDLSATDNLLLNEKVHSEIFIFRRCSLFTSNKHFGRHRGIPVTILSCTLTLLKHYLITAESLSPKLNMVRIFVFHFLHRDPYTSGDRVCSCFGRIRKSSLADWLQGEFGELALQRAHHWLQVAETGLEKVLLLFSLFGGWFDNVPTGTVHSFPSHTKYHGTSTKSWHNLVLAA